MLRVCVAVRKKLQVNILVVSFEMGKLQLVIIFHVFEWLAWMLFFLSFTQDRSHIDSLSHFQIFPFYYRLCFGKTKPSMT